MSSRPHPILVNLKTDLTQRRNYYRDNLETPTINAFRVALDEREKTYAKQAKSDQLGMELVLICLLATGAALMPVAGAAAGVALTGGYVGTRAAMNMSRSYSVLRSLAKARANLAVQLGQRAAPATKYGGSSAAHLLKSVLKDASSDATGYGKFYMRAHTAIASAQPQGPVPTTSTFQITNPKFFETDFTQYVGEQFDVVYRFVDFLANDPEITDESAAQIDGYIRQRPIFTGFFRINKEALALKYELLFYLYDLLSSDQLVQMRHTSTPYGAVSSVVSRTPIDAMPSSSKYPKGTTTTGICTSTSTHVSRTDPGKDVVARLNTVYQKVLEAESGFDKENKTRSGDFIDDSWLWNVNDVDHGTMLKAERCLLDLVDSTSYAGDY